MMKLCACVLLLAVLADSAPQFFYQEVPLPEETHSGHRRLRSYEYVAVYPGAFSYSGASGVANAGFYPYGFHPYGIGSSAASSAAAYGGRNGLAPYGAASAVSAAQTHGYRGSASAASAAASGTGYY